MPRTAVCMCTLTFKNIIYSGVFFFQYLNSELGAEERRGSALKPAEVCEAEFWGVKPQ